MSTLTQVAITSRKTVRYIIYFIVFLTLGRIFFGFGVQLYLKIFPPGPPAPTVKFGKLPKINFPPSNTVVKLNFALETPTGTFPANIPTQAKVYFMPKLSSNLLALDNAKSKAEQLGFLSTDPIIESDTLYKFTFKNAPSIMEMNIVTGAFSISYDLASDRSAILSRPPVAEVAATNFKSYLSSANSLPEDLTGPMIPSYYKLESGALTKVLALSEADVTKVNLFRKEYDKLPSLTASPYNANVWAIISGTQERGKQVIASEYHYFPVDETKYSTYPIITPEEAFKKLQDGKAYVASMGQYKEGDNLKIRKVYLAYFDPDVPSDFYQPIYVFDSNENDPENSFIGYIPAVSSSYYPEN
jgi:hypothetical protein